MAPRVGGVPGLAAEPLVVNMAPQFGRSGEHQIPAPDPARTGRLERDAGPTTLLLPIEEAVMPEPLLSSPALVSRPIDFRRLRARAGSTACAAASLALLVA